MDYVKIEVWIKNINLTWVVQNQINIQESNYIPTELL
jgi:hypothetical protein